MSQNRKCMGVTGHPALTLAHRFSFHGLNQFTSDDHRFIFESGLETMHLLTQAKTYELKVDIEVFDGQRVFAQYSSFTVGPESDGYKLSLGDFIRGPAGGTL